MDTTTPSPTELTLAGIRTLIQLDYPSEASRKIFDRHNEIVAKLKQELAESIPKAKALKLFNYWSANRDKVTFKELLSGCK